MNVLAHDILVTPRWRLGVWATRAWRRMGWRHVLLALLIELVRSAIHPLGGILFPPTVLPGWDPVVHLIDGTWLVIGLPIVYCVLVADEAFNDGVHPLRAYGLAVVVLTAVVPIAGRLFVGVVQGSDGQAPGFDEGAAQFVWWSLVVVYEGGFGLAIYAYWRVTQRAMRQAHAAATERVRNEQRVQTARLLALQSRVEPQLLFDALGRVGALHDRDPQTADALLADLIALLRSMLPGARADTSTVEREFALVQAWLRVTRSAGREVSRVRMHVTPDARRVGIAPMLLLPLLRQVLTLHSATHGEWLLSARVTGLRLSVALQPNTQDGNVDARGVLESADLSSLHDRLAQLFGRSAHLAVSTRPPSLTLDLPRMREDSNDDRIDR
jgi:GNAT superfamily N-acetyltransferase